MKKLTVIFSQNLLMSAEKFVVQAFCANIILSLY